MKRGTMQLLAVSLVTLAVATSVAEESWGQTLSCVRGDNEEGGCCCRREAHTYLFEPREVSHARVSFDTGRGFDCRSKVKIRLMRQGRWATASEVKAISARDGNELNLITRTLDVAGIIEGVRVEDDGKCYIDRSEVELVSPASDGSLPSLDLSCKDRDNEERACCCRLDQHTYRFEPFHVTRAKVRFDTGRGHDCRSDVEIEVLRDGDWEGVSKVKAVSARGGNETNMTETSLWLDSAISGLRIGDGCKCCIDGSEVHLEGELSQAMEPATRTPAPVAIPQATPRITPYPTAPPRPTLNLPPLPRPTSPRDTSTGSTLELRGSLARDTGHTESHELVLDRPVTITRVEGNATHFCIWTVPTAYRGVRKVLCGGGASPSPAGTRLEPDSYIVLPTLDEGQSRAEVIIHLRPDPPAP